jgi:hypothetical protein
VAQVRTDLQAISHAERKWSYQVPGVAGYQRNNVSTPPAADRSLAASRPGLGFHLIPVPVHHVDRAPMMKCPGSRVAK